MLRSKKPSTEDLKDARENNIKNWNDEDRAFYEDFLKEVPDTLTSKFIDESTIKKNEAWVKFQDRNKKLLAGKG